MPRTEVTQLIADNLAALPHPDGRPRRWMHHSQFAGGAQDVRAQAAVKQLGTDHGDGIQHLLEQNGYTISHHSDAKPADAEGYKTAHLKCLSCGQQLLALGLSAQMTATLGRTALKTLAEILREHTECRPA